MTERKDEEIDAYANIVSYLTTRGYMIEPEALEALNSLGDDAEKVLSQIIDSKKSSVNDKLIKIEDIISFIPARESPAQQVVETELEVVSDPTNEIKPLKPLEGYSRLFTDRYNKLLALLRQRPDSKGVVTSSSIVRFSEGSKVKVAGLLFSRTERKNGVEVTLDDSSGPIRVYFREGLVQQALKVPLDSLLMIEGIKLDGNQLLATRLTLPDIPEHKPVLFSHRIYAVLLSDLHIGSKMFLEEDFKRFLRWLNKGDGDEDIVSRIKYLVVAGDLVDGIGVYPDQEMQLEEKEPVSQYDRAYDLLSQVPDYITIVISPGNHDMVRQALPQPAIPSNLARKLYGMENVVFVGSPAYVKLSGVLFLIFHGRSLDDVIASTPDLSYRRPSEAMKILLKARHLAPIYGKRTAISPEPKDMLVIDTVPDVMHSGHVHTLDYQDYKGTLIINSGTFQGQTPFQQNMGLEPTPSIVPVIDLSNLTILRRSFSSHLSFST